MASNKQYDNLHKLKKPPHGNAIAAMHELQDNKIEERDVGRIPDAIGHIRFVSTLSDECTHTKETLQAMKHRDRDEIIRMLGTKNSNLPQKNGSQQSSRPPEREGRAGRPEAGHGGGRSGGILVRKLR